VIYRAHFTRGGGWLQGEIPAAADPLAFCTAILESWNLPDAETPDTYVVEYVEWGTLGPKDNAGRYQLQEVGRVWPPPPPPLDGLDLPIERIDVTLDPWRQTVTLTPFPADHPGYIARIDGFADPGAILPVAGRTLQLQAGRTRELVIVVTDEDGAEAQRIEVTATQGFIPAPSLAAAGVSLDGVFWRGDWVVTKNIPVTVDPILGPQAPGQTYVNGAGLAVTPETETVSVSVPAQEEDSGLECLQAENRGLLFPAPDEQDPEWLEATQALSTVTYAALESRNPMPAVQTVNAICKGRRNEDDEQISREFVFAYLTTVLLAGLSLALLNELIAKAGTGLAAGVLGRLSESVAASNVARQAVRKAAAAQAEHLAGQAARRAAYERQAATAEALAQVHIDRLRALNEAPLEQAAEAARQAANQRATLLDAQQAQLLRGGF